MWSIRVIPNLSQVFEIKTFNSFVDFHDGDIYVNAKHFSPCQFETFFVKYKFSGVKGNHACLK